MSAGFFTGVMIMPAGSDFTETTPRRVIFLVDMNAFFISCETTRRSELAGVPAAVAGDPAYRAGIILAANYEARRCGVRTTMVIHEARRLCPNLVLVAPDHAFYEEKSAEVMALLSRYTPLVEPNSIDEAWLDMTGCEGLSGPPLVAAEAIMSGIREELGLWCSIGIAGNKYLAKMAADMKKPMGITELWPSDISSKMWPLPAGELLGVGKKSTERLAKFGIRTIGELARTDVTLLEKWFGRAGPDLWKHAWGLDEEPVVPPKLDEMKSIGRSTTLQQDITDVEAALTVLLQLVDEVAAGVRRHGKLARVVHISLKHADFTTMTRQASVPATADTTAIFRTAQELLVKNWTKGKPVRLIGISVSGFEEEGQLSLFDLPVAPPRVQQQIPVVFKDTDQESERSQASEVPGLISSTKMESARSHALDKTLDSLRERFGEASVQRARLLGQEKPKRHGGPNHKTD